MSDEETIINCLGTAVPRRLVRPERLLEDQLVHDLVAKADALREAIAAFKAKTFEDIDALRTLLSEQYQVNLGGRRGGLRLHSFDLTLRIEISVADMLTFGPELQAAKALVDECLTEWSDAADPRLKAIVMNAFDVGESGKLKVQRILELRQFNITDAKWVRAMQAINDAIRVERSRQYVRLYRRGDMTSPFVQIVLDASRV